MCHCEQITFTWENITVVKENGGGSCFRKKKESSKTILNNGEYLENHTTPYLQIQYHAENTIFGYVTHYETYDI